MPNEGAALARPWREVAAELASETDPEKITALTLELERALEKRDKTKKSGQ
jgi:hypothetical protein